MLRCLSSRLRGSTSVGCTPVCVPLLRPEPQRLELCGRPGPAGGLGRPGAGGTPCSALGRHAAVSRLTTGWQHRVRARAAAGAPRAVRVFGSCLVSSWSERRTCGLPLAAAVRPPLFRGCGGGGPARAGTTGPARARGLHAGGERACVLAPGSPEFDLGTRKECILWIL